MAVYHTAVIFLQSAYAGRRGADVRIVAASKSAKVTGVTALNFSWSQSTKRRRHRSKAALLTSASRGSGVVKPAVLWTPFAPKKPREK